MIPIPDYLTQYATESNQTKQWLFFKLKCLCGCKSFAVLERCYTNEEKQFISEFENKTPNTGWRTVYGGLDSDGNPYKYIKVFGIFKKRVTFPQPPAFMDVNVIKAVCSECQKEIVLFDSRCHGYKGIISDDAEIHKYIPHLKPRDCKLYGIEVTIENEPSLEAFNENLNEKCSPEFYSNAFSWIRICGLDAEGTRKVLFECETD